jgi:hypothetical protein
VPADERISSFDFYNFEKGHALRQLIVFQDNAAYNHGRDVRIKSLSKNDCADLLRQLFPEKTHIEVHNVLATRGSAVPVFDEYRIPAVGEKWQVAFERWISGFSFVIRSKTAARSLGALGWPTCHFSPTAGILD